MNYCDFKSLKQIFIFFKFHLLRPEILLESLSNLKYFLEIFKTCRQIAFKYDFFLSVSLDFDIHDITERNVVESSLWCQYSNVFKT